MLVCPRCKDIFDISAENIEAILDENGQTIGWRHVNCNEAVGRTEDNTRTKKKPK